MKKVRYLLLIFVCLVAFRAGKVAIVYAANCPDFVKMSNEEFIRWCYNNSVNPVAHPYEQGCNYYVKYNGLRVGCYDYDWANASTAEVNYILTNFKGKIVYSPSTEAFAAALNRRMHDSGNGGWYEARKEEQMNALLNIQTEKMWKDSVLTGDDNSHGVINSTGDVYNRTEVGSGSVHYTVDGVVVDEAKIADSPLNKLAKSILDALGGVVYNMAEKLNGLLGGVGISIDTIIFGRVAGYGIKLNGGTPVALFSFELANGNPYGFVAAVIFQRIRMFVYAFLSILCLYRLIVVGVKGDYERMKMDFSDFLQNAFLAFSLIVLMPYILEMYLYIRDILLKSITYQTLNQLFGSRGFIDAFRNNAVATGQEFVSSLIYLAAVGVSIFMAGIYIAYAMSMMIHFILFPFVCIRGMLDRRVYGEWISETVGLTIMPIIDGMILVIPLTFSQMANGNMAFNFLSLISCWMVLTARGQARRTLGVKESGLDMKAIASVIGLGKMAGGVSHAIGKAGKKFGGAVKSLKEAKADKDMAKYYEELDPKAVGESPAVTDPAGSDVASRKPVPPPMPSKVAEKHSNAGNFENDAFRGKLSNQRMAQMYRRRARASYGNALKQGISGVTSVYGGVQGGLLGFGVGAMAGSSMQMALTGLGADIGASKGGLQGGLIGLGGTAIAKPVTMIHDKREDKKYFGEKKTGKSGGRSPLEGERPEGGENPYDESKERGIETPVPPSGGPASNPSQLNEEDDKGPIPRSKMSPEVQKKSLEHLCKENIKNSYHECAAKASVVVSLEFKNFKDSDVVTGIKEKLNGIKNDAENGTDSYDNLSERYKSVHGEMRSHKMENLKNQFVAQLKASPEAGFNESEQHHVGASNIVIESFAQNQLTREDRYMTNAFDEKNFGIEWAKVKEKIKSMKE